MSNNRPDPSNDYLAHDKQGHSPKRELSWKVASSLEVSFRYAWNGVSYAFQTQRNFRLQTVIASLAIGLSLYLRISLTNFAIICLTIGVVLTLELLNTAIESVVDLTVKQTYHDLAKIAKDCSAGAVLVSSLASIVIASSLLLPPLMGVIQTLNFFEPR